MRKLIFIFTFIIGNSFGFAQVLKNFDKIYGGDGFDRPTDVFYKTGKNYVFGTITKTGTSVGNISQSYGKMDYAMVIYDNTGAKIKDVCFGGNRNDSLVKVIDLDSAFIMVGWACSDNGTGNKNSNNSILNNNSLDVTNSISYGPYKEIYCVMVDLEGNTVKEFSIPVTQDEYISYTPNDLLSLGNVAKASTSLVDNSDPANPFIKFNYLLGIYGVQKNGNWIKIFTSETARLKVSGYNYTTGIHTSTVTGTQCNITPTVNVGYDKYDLGCELGYYSIDLDLTQYTKDQEIFMGYRSYNPNVFQQLPCPNNCSDLSWHYKYNLGLTSINHYDYIGFESIDALNHLNIKVGLPIITKAWYEPNQGVWFYKQSRYVTYLANDGFEKPWPGKRAQMINTAIFGCPNYILGDPKEMIFHNNKCYVISEQIPTPSSTFNTTTPLPPDGVASYAYVSFLRNMTAAPGTGLVTKKDLWVTEHNYSIYTYTTPSSPTPQQGVAMSNPLRQVSIRANDDVFFGAKSEVFDTNKVFLSLSTQGGQVFDKRNPNKGGLDYWPVKFNLDKMSVLWDTTIGGVGEDIATAVRYEKGILVITGKSKSNIGQDKTSNAYDVTNGDFWTVNYCLPPKVDFLASPLILSPGGTVTFTTTNTEAGEFNWFFSDNSNSFEQNPVHYFYTPGWYSIDVIASNGVCQVITSKPNYIYVNGYAGVQELNISEINNTIYPNPTTGIFNLKVKGSITSIKNSLGEDVNYKNDNEQIDIGNNEAGIYFVQYKWEGNYYTVKLIKQ